MNKTKAVLFDLDGTLVDSLQTVLIAYRYALTGVDKQLSDDEIITVCFNKTEEAICESLGIPEKSEEFKQIYINWIRQLTPQIKLYPEVEPVLHALKKEGVKMGIITFAFRFYAQQLLEQCNLKEYSSVTISFDDVAKAKPDPEAVLTACSKLGVTPGETIVVGDAENDILMGKAAGSQTVLFTPPANARFTNFDEVIKETRPVHVITSLSELLPLVK